jgi:hypothetical protein
LNPLIGIALPERPEGTFRPRRIAGAIVTAAGAPRIGSSSDRGCGETPSFPCDAIPAGRSGLGSCLTTSPRGLEGYGDPEWGET